MVVNHLLDNFEEVLTGKDLVINRLQSRAVDNTLVVEAPFQRHFKLRYT